MLNLSSPIWYQVRVRRPSGMPSVNLVTFRRELRMNLSAIRGWNLVLAYKWDTDPPGDVPVLLASQSGLQL